MTNKESLSLSYIVGGHTFSFTGGKKVVKNTHTDVNVMLYTVTSLFHDAGMLYKLTH